MSFTDNERENRLGKLAGIAGISAVVFNFIPLLTYLSVVLGPFALIAGLIALRRQPRTMSIVGVVTGAIYIGTVAFIAFTLVDSIRV